jgi:tight adherence protein B
MMLAAADQVRQHWQPIVIFGSVLILGLTASAVYLGAKPLRDFILHRESEYEVIFRRALLLDISPRAITVATGAVILLLGFMGYAVARGVLGVLIGGAVGVFLPHAMIRYLRRRRLRKLEDQLVGGVQTVASGVRAGLNLVQSISLVARDGPSPLRQEFAHLTREYEYGISLDEAMRNAAERIGSSDFRLLFSALQTHRERGGDLGETLDRIAESIREIQRLEKRVQTLTAQGRATARWLGAMPLVIGLILYAIDSGGVKKLFTEPLGNLILLAIVVLTILGFLWIKKVVSIDI